MICTCLVHEHQPFGICRRLSRTCPHKPFSISIINYCVQRYHFHSTATMAGQQTSPVRCDVDVVLAGQTGVGKSSLVNMIMGVGDEHGAQVSNDVRPCTEKTTPYITKLEGSSLQCQLWDTRGLDEASDDPSIMAMALSWFRGIPQCERELKDFCKERTKYDRGQTMPLFIWCIHASKITVPVHWQQFRKAYVDYCGRKVKPVVVITQMAPKFETDWREKCEEQLRQLDLKIVPGNPSDLLVRVRKHHGISSIEYREDSQAVRDTISLLSGSS
ncbi:hypothetical protein BS17DRAFT_115294 [Gyrodon lividus]|nr:hypothetical protein BS17DRAFT_115294 [Gyrodon lividus]